MSALNGQPRILFIDSYDSFTHNLAALCRQSISGSKIHIIKNDSFTITQLLPHIPSFDCIIVGPGPGSPSNPSDIGIVRDLWHLTSGHLTPIFGVCLGLQSLAIENGASLYRLEVVKHGQISHVNHTGSDLFKGVGEVQAVRYHSLHVRIPENGDLEELAWADDAGENGKVTMALRHNTKPFWAVQYHPESVKTSGGGLDVMQNFWKLAKNWNRLHRPARSNWTASSQALFGASWPPLSIPRSPVTKTPTAPRTLIIKTLCSPEVTSTLVAELFGASDEASPFVLLDSAAQPGRYSIIASLTPSSPRLTHYIGDDFILFTQDGSTIREYLRGQDIWNWMATFMQARQVIGGRKSIPFWGGLVGYLGYELGCEHLEARHPPGEERTRSHPDLNLVFVERSVVVDTAKGKFYVQSIIPGDEEWVNRTTVSIATEVKKRPAPCPSISSMSNVHISLPDRQRYLSHIRDAKDHLAAGNSYELCLTAQTSVILTRTPHDILVSTSWQMYKSLRKKNPAPYSAYLRLHPSTVMSSSPERFLSYTRPPKQTYQLRPIKGTLRKSPAIKRQDAEKGLRGSNKEVAENLMIVDLIRHDLYGVVGEDVEVTKFCGIEEYETVWQMVSVVEGKAKSTATSMNKIGRFDTRDNKEERERDGGLTGGWEVLRHCLPPGSMTGAPKKRSVEILRELEDTPRGIYSGVIGYWDVGGGGDWSVVIRSCFKHDDKEANSNGPGEEVWTLGAGGAITALSEPEAEWDEMVLKLRSVLGIFDIGKQT